MMAPVAQLTLFCALDISKTWESGTFCTVTTVNGQTDRQTDRQIDRQTCRRNIIGMLFDWFFKCFVSTPRNFTKLFFSYVTYVKDGKTNITKGSISAGEMYLKICRMGRWWFWSWFNVNRSTVDLDLWNLNIKFASLVTTIVQRYVSTKLEVSTAFVCR